MDFSDNPVLWQRTPVSVAADISHEPVVQQAITKAIEAERAAARPYVRSCTDAVWADEPQVQERIHAITVNGVDVTAVCVGFNTDEGWAELLITAGVHADGRPRWVPNRRRNGPLTVRVTGSVQVEMSGALNPVVYQNGAARQAVAAHV
jgi:hypothetical protein